MSRRSLLVNTAFALVLGMMFVASTTQATSQTGGAIAQASAQVTTSTTDLGGVVPFPDEATRITTTLSGIVTATRLRVRDAATLNGKKIFSLIQGQIVTILGIHTNRRWLEIKSGDGQIGWVSVYYIQLVGGELRMLAFVQ